MKSVYLDNAATTPVDPEVFQAMKPYFLTRFGNASEPHDWGQIARQAVGESRQVIAKHLNAHPSEIIFTSCATESINLAHKGLIESLYKGRKLHIITTAIEHKAVLETCKHLEKLGWADVTYLPVDKFGLVTPADVAKAIRPETVLVSIIYVNNEVGTVQPIAEIGAMLQKSKNKIYFHTDATQAMQYFDCDVKKLGVDLLSFTGHKFYAPKGIGALFAAKNVPLVRQQDGGSQERNLRAGTENVPYIIALAKALELSSKVKNLSPLRDKLINGVLKIPGVKLTGHPEKRAPHIASFTIDGVEGEALLLMLSDKGIAAASGSACTSGLLSPSHVLLAMGIKAENAHGSLRLSLGKNTTQDDIDYVLKVLPPIINRLRLMAPKL